MSKQTAKPRARSKCRVIDPKIGVSNSGCEVRIEPRNRENGPREPLCNPLQMVRRFPWQTSLCPIWGGGSSTGGERWVLSDRAVPQPPLLFADWPSLKRPVAARSLLGNRLSPKQNCRRNRYLWRQKFRTCRITFRHRDRTSESPAIRSYSITGSNRLSKRHLVWFDSWCWPELRQG